MSVSRPVAESMARGVRRATGADVGLSVTGVAGPGGGSADMSFPGNPGKPKTSAALIYGGR